MVLETERLLLRPYKTKDLAGYHALMSSPEVWTYSTQEPHTSLSQSRRNMRKTKFHALFEQESGRYIGEAGILSMKQSASRCEIGYNLLPEFWGHGYATEIAKALVGYAFDELKVERVEALAIKANVASCGVLEKAGLALEGTLRHFARIRGTYQDVCYYAIIASDTRG